MTKKEALEWNNKCVPCDILIEDIYKSFENRICKNCKYLKIFTGGCDEDKAYYCEKHKEYLPYIIDELSCKNFKKKD